MERRPVNSKFAKRRASIQVLKDSASVVTSAAAAAVVMAGATGAASSESRGAVAPTWSIAAGTDSRAGTKASGSNCKHEAQQVKSAVAARIAAWKSNVQLHGHRDAMHCSMAAAARRAARGGSGSPVADASTYTPPAATAVHSAIMSAAQCARTIAAA